MAKRRFEFVDGGSNKFWEVWIDGNAVYTHYGRIGANGQTTIKEEGDAAKASRLLEKLVAEKTKKGYVESDGLPANGPAKAANNAPASPPAVAFDGSKYAAQIAKIETRATKSGYELPAGASATSIARAEAELGIAFPAEVRAFYLAHDGGSSSGELVCGGRELLSIERIVDEWKVWKELLDGGKFEDNDNSEPDAGIQQKWWIPEWIPVSYDGAGNHHMIDMAPAKGGHVGQLFSFWHDEAQRSLDAPNFLAWLTKQSWSEDGDDDSSDQDSDDVSDRS
jgi:cell wall assembly regulator SMI1/predicted DNA-binding WGR domain protein